jgi:hypothetical protein
MSSSPQKDGRHGITAHLHRLAGRSIDLPAGCIRCLLLRIHLQNQFKLKAVSMDLPFCDAD